MVKRQKSTESPPLAEGVTQQIFLSTCFAGAGARLGVSDRWVLDSGTRWLGVNQVSGAGSGEVCLRWVCKRFEGIFAVLESAISVIEPEVRPQYAVAEVVNRNTIRVLEDEELKKVLPHIQAEIVGRRIWDSEMKEDVLFGDFESVFGEFREL